MSRNPTSIRMSDRTRRQIREIAKQMGWGDHAQSIVIDYAINMLHTSIAKEGGEDAVRVEN